MRKPTEEQEVSIPPSEGTDRPNKSVYKMTSKPRGIGNAKYQHFNYVVVPILKYTFFLAIGLVINNKHFTNGMKDRVGTDRDAESLTELSTFLGFKTKRYNDVTGKNIRAILEV